jgi:mRNA interferase MazF
MALTTNLAAAAMPGNVLLPASATGLSRDSVANVTQISTLNRYELLEPPAGSVPTLSMQLIGKGIGLALGLKHV